MEQQGGGGCAVGLLLRCLLADCLSSTLPTAVGCFIGFYVYKNKMETRQSTSIRKARSVQILCQ